MTNNHLHLAAAAALLACAGFANAGGSDDDKKGTVETRLLRILKERGVLSEKEYEELVKLGAEMRAEEVHTNLALEREIATLTEKVSQQSPETKKASPDVKATYKFGKGVTFSNEDFSMTMGGREQVRFSYIRPDGTTTSGQDDRASFDVRRLRIWWEGWAFSQDVTYKVQVDFANTAGDILRDAWLDYRFSPEFHIRGGQMERVITRQMRESSGDLMFPDRVSTVERFRSLAGDYDVGAMAWGELEQKQFEWYTGVNNGEGKANGTPAAVNLGPAAGGLNVANTSNNDANGLEFYAVLVWNPNGPPGYSESDFDLTQDPKPSIGLNFQYTPERRGNPLGIAAGAGGIPAGELPQYSATTVGPDFEFKYQGIFLQGEAYWRGIQAEGHLADAAGHFKYSTETGAYVEAGYFLGQEKGKGPEIAGRFAFIDFDNNLVAVGGTTMVKDYTVGLNYYFAGHSLKLQAAATYRQNIFRGPAPTDNDQIFQLQAQLKF